MLGRPCSSGVTPLAFRPNDCRVEGPRRLDRKNIDFGTPPVGGKGDLISNLEL